MPAEMAAAIIGFFNFKVTPYKAGSVMPIMEEIHDAEASCFIDLLLERMATASVAPP
ncbi:hypothetical protein D3C78_1507670 [compost metagenome]